MGTTTTTFALNKPTVGGDDNAWGTDWNTNADKLDDLLDGTTAVKPNLSEGLWKIGGTAVTATAAELNILDRELASFVTVTGTTGTVTLTAAQYQTTCLKSGTVAFTANVTFSIPSGISGHWIVTNQSASNAFVLIVKNAAGGAGVSIGNGLTRTVYSDGSTVIFSDAQDPVAPQTVSIGAGFATTNANCAGTTATVTFSGGYLIAVGQIISIKGVTPAGYNGVFTVTASSAGSVTFTVPTTQTNQTVAGTLYYGAINGSTLNLSETGVISGVASQAEAEAGTDSTKLMTPLRTAQAISALSTVLLGTLTTTSGSAQTLSGLVLTDYKFLHFTLNAVSTSGSTGTIGLGPITDLFGPAAGTSSVSGMAWVDLGNGVATAPTKLAADSRVGTGASGYSTATTSVSVNVSAGTFDAGSIRIYGVK